MPTIQGHRGWYDHRKVRSCPVCRRDFLPAKNSRSCSPECGAVLRTKRLKKRKATSKTPMEAQS